MDIFKYEIPRYLAVRDFYNLSLTCKECQTSWHNNHIWNLLTLRDFSETGGKEMFQLVGRFERWL